MFWILMELCIWTLYPFYGSWSGRLVESQERWFQYELMEHRRKNGMEDSRASNADVIVLFNTETMPRILTPIRASRNYSSFFLPLAFSPTTECRADWRSSKRKRKEMGKELRPANMRWRNTFGLLRSMNHEVIGVDVDGQDALQLREDAAYCDDDTTVLFSPVSRERF